MRAEKRLTTTALWRTVNGMNLNGAEVDTLVALVEQGPLWDGDVPSKTGRDRLIDRGLATRVVVKGEDGWTAASYTGRDAYRALYPGPDGPAETIKQAMLMRNARTLDEVQAVAELLVRRAVELGVVLSIEQRSVPPLAMGNYVTEVSVRKAREPG